MSETIIKLENVTKKYRLYKNERKRLIGAFNPNIKYREKIASNNLSFSIDKGESVAFLGSNGAGKSTLLKLITGVTFPTEGDIIIKGRVSALLELTSGFDPQLTGLENIKLKGQVMGISDKEIKKLTPEIIKFADIGEYMDLPVKTYSSGMKARLGFAINVNVEPEILIVDEALSVGDKKFRIKCKRKVAQLLETGDVTLLFVTHSVAVAEEFCKRGIVMEKGKIVFDGTISDAIDFYGKD